MKKRFSQSSNSFFVYFALLSLTLSQEYGTVKGRVNSEDSGEKLISVNVEVLGKSLGAVTDVDGQYRIQVPAGSHTLRFTYVGFTSKNVKVTVKPGEELAMNVKLSESVLSSDIVLVIGTRSQKNRSETETPVPIDVIDIQKLVADAPQTTINQILNFVAPSFSSNTQTISDGTDHIDPASLRGLGPDQVLVLINGKRRHNSSLINVNGTFGRGSVGTDLNAIPAASIKRIEVLRDGAAAQYGSDAIAGVINIVLKNDVNKLTVTSNAGANVSKNSKNSMDGESAGFSMNFGLPLGTKGGFINFTGNYDDRQHTNRMKSYAGTIFKGYNNPTASYTDSLTEDITEDELKVRGLTRHDFNMRVGQSAVRNGGVFFNMDIPVAKNSHVYAFGGISYRKGAAAGFYRLPYQERTVTSVYPNGFLPEIHSNIYDRSFAIGIEGKIREWNIDFSNTFGSNSFQFQIENTLNASLLGASKTSYNSGGFSFSQNTTNFDASKFFPKKWDGLNIAFGAEYRVENYQIFAGEEGSYAKYDKDGDIVTPNTKDDLIVKGPNGKARPGGAQVFPGFRPINERDALRNSLALYADFEADFTDAFFLGLAGRFENYSDFGATFNFKVATRLKLNDSFSLRGAGSTGFRAPSLHQQNYNATSTLFVDGVPNEIGVFSNDSRIAKLLGIPKLNEEKSRNFSLGFTGLISKYNLSITVDAYSVSIDNRIVETGTFKPKTGEDPELRSLLSSVNATGAAFFSNAIDTKTQGLDVVLTHQAKFLGGNLKSDLAMTFSRTKKVGDIHASKLLESKKSIYFDETSRIYLEEAVPRTKINLTFSWKNDAVSLLLRNVYFGDVNEATNNIKYKQTFSAKVVTDLTFGYQIADGIKLTLGASNLLDIYPDEISSKKNRSSERFIYSRRSQQFGTNGRYVFTRMSFNL